MDFVLHLRKPYEENGWSCLQPSAQAVGYSRGTISRYLSGERQPKAYVLDKLFDATKDRTGRPATETVRAKTRRLHFTSVVSSNAQNLWIGLGTAR